MQIEKLQEVSKDNAVIEGTYVISKCELKPFKQKSGSFLTCELTDKTGTIKGVIWENAEKVIEKIENRSVVSLKAECTRYNDVPQLIIMKLTKIKKFNKADFVPSLDNKIVEEILKSLKETSSLIKKPLYKAIWDYLIFNKPENLIQEDFKQCPGGVNNVHHSYLGGLLEHSTSMINIAKTFVNKYEDIDLDTILTGCLIHDIGKIKTYKWDTILEMGDRGRLLHHISLGLLVLNQIIDNIYPNVDLTEEDNHNLMLLQHIIVSHHQNDGVPKPMTVEAQIVADLDNLDASANYSVGFIKGSNNENESNWTRYSVLRERRYYSPISPKKIEISENKESINIESDSLF